MEEILVEDSGSSLSFRQTRQPLPNPVLSLISQHLSNVVAAAVLAVIFNSLFRERSISCSERFYQCGGAR